MNDLELDEIWNDFEQDREPSNLQLSQTPKTNQCINCNKQEFITEYGDIICTECGTIKEGSIISDDPEWNNYIEDGVMDSSGNRCGTVLDPTNPYDQASCFVPKFLWSIHYDSEGNKRYTNLSKLMIRMQYTSKQRAFDEGKYSFERIKEQLGLSEMVFNTAKLYWGIILKTDILKRGGNRRGMKACCIFYACLSEKQQRTRDDIGKAFDIDGSADFSKGEKIFREIFEKDPKYSWILYSTSENETMYIRYISQLGLPFKVYNKMIIIKEQTKDHLLGIAAKSEIAGLLYFTTKEIFNLKHPNKSEIAKSIGVCNPTLNKVIEILKYYYKKFPDDYQKVIDR